MKKINFYLMWLLGLTSIVANGESRKVEILKHNLVKIDDSNFTQLDAELKSRIRSIPLEANEQMYLEINEAKEIIDLKIFKEEVFSEARVDWRVN